MFTHLEFVTQDPELPFDEHASSGGKRVVINLLNKTFIQLKVSKGVIALRCYIRVVVQFQVSGIGIL